MEQKTKEKKNLRPKKFDLRELTGVQGKISFDKPEIKNKEDQKKEEAQEYLKEKKRYGPPNTSGISTENTSIPFMRGI